MIGARTSAPAVDGREITKNVEQQLGGEQVSAPRRTRQAC
jgi:hypothetical protein